MVRTQVIHKGTAVVPRRVAKAENGCEGVIDKQETFKARKSGRELNALARALLPTCNRDFVAVYNPAQAFSRPLANLAHRLERETGFPSAGQDRGRQRVLGVGFEAGRFIQYFVSFEPRGADDLRQRRFTVG